MPHAGGQTSKLSRDLANVRLQLRSGKTRSQNPRDLTQEEIDALTQKRDALLAEMAARSKERVVNRINGHVTSEADRVIASQQQMNSSVAALDALFLRGGCQRARDRATLSAWRRSNKRKRACRFKSAVCGSV